TNFVILDRTAGCGPVCPVVWEDSGYPVPLSQFTPRIDANPIWLFFPVHSQGDCSSFTVAGSGQASQRGPF
ncbi:MAG TPA: hypothetical protein VMV80_00150, partial [Anaerolineales bacterium]|nr:hypothetical protein [Anaerolineales bacterium]